MKKLVIGVAAALLLTGCAQPAEPTTVPTEPTTAASEPASEPTEAAKQFYVPDSPMERGTGGAVRVYQMDGSVTGLSALGENLLVYSDNRVLHLLDPTATEEIRTRELEQPMAWGGGDLQITDQGLAFYEEAAATCVTLDRNLLAGPSYELAEKPLLRPLISADLSSIYYVTGEGIRTMDLQQGTSRLLRQEHEQIVRLDALAFSDSVLIYTRQLDDGLEQTCFVDAETGGIRRTNRFQGRLLSREDHFSSVLKVEHTLGQENWVVRGSRDGRIRRLIPDAGWGNPILLTDEYVLLQQRSKVGLTLVCYDMAADRQISRVLMPQQQNLMAYGSMQDGAVWLCDGSSSRFYRWEIRNAAPGELAARMGDYPSLGSPDQEALDQTMQTARELGEQWGVELVFDQQDNRTAGADYSERPDYQSAQNSAALERLRRAVEKLPEGFLAQVGRRTDSDRLRLVLTDRYDPMYSQVPVTGSFRVDGGTAQLDVTMCSDLEAIFYHELFHVMEVQIRNAGDGLNTWNSLNPPDFSYPGSEQAADSPLLQPGENHFADGFAMVSGREDRAQLFMYACMDGQQERFASEPMQRKLQSLSDLIRQTYELEGTPVWEQYLPQEAPAPTQTP